MVIDRVAVDMKFTSICTYIIPRFYVDIHGLSYRPIPILYTCILIHKVQWFLLRKAKDKTFVVDYTENMLLSNAQTRTSLLEEVNFTTKIQCGTVRLSTWIKVSMDISMVWPNSHVHTCIYIHEPISMQIGTSGPCGYERSTSRVRESKVKVTKGRSEIWRPGGDIILDFLSRI